MNMYSFRLSGWLSALLLGGLVIASSAQAYERQYVIRPGDNLWIATEALIQDRAVWAKVWTDAKRLVDGDLRTALLPGDVLIVDQQPDSVNMRLERDGRTLYVGSRIPIRTAVSNNNSDSTDLEVVDLGETLDTTLLDIEDEDADGALGTGQLVRISPQIHYEGKLAHRAIPTEVVTKLQAFADDLRISSEAQMESYGRVDNSVTGRLTNIRGDSIYVTDLDQTVRPDDNLYGIFRPSYTKAIIDPQNGESIGFDLYYVGTAEVVEYDDGNNSSLLKITEAKREITKGDVVVPLNQTTGIGVKYSHLPNIEFEGEVLSLHNATDSLGATRYGVIMLNLGTQNGLKNGDLVGIHEDGRTVVSVRQAERGASYQIGTAIIFHIVDNASFALINNLNYSSVRVGYRVTNPT